MLGVLLSQETTTLRGCSIASAERMQNFPSPTSFGLFWYEEWIVVRLQGAKIIQGFKIDLSGFEPSPDRIPSIVLGQIGGEILDCLLIHQKEWVEKI